MTEDILKKIWTLSANVENSDSYNELNRLTQELVKVYDAQNRLSQDPFAPTRERRLSLPVASLQKELTDSTCLVTGGLGCVGSTLVNELLNFDVKTIVILDNKATREFSVSEKVVIINCDVRDLQRVTEIFAQYKPDHVFHTAAQRDPGFAESNIVESVTTNVLGTLNIVKACEATESVKQMVFSSTGKASRYFTEEVYAGTKKVCEFILDTYARESKVKYSLTRFTHILDNSLMNEELKRTSEHDQYVAVHSPGKYVTAQNSREAAYLMLNALVYSVEQQCNLLLVRCLEWPVESLEMALYHLKQSGRVIPVIFVGNPIGYCEKFFRGQLDWSRPNELNLLINVYEQKHRHFNEGEDIIISRACPTSQLALVRALQKIEDADGELQTREALLEGLRSMVIDSLKQVDKEQTSSILRWGLDPGFLEMENKRVADFNTIVPLLEQSLADSITTEQELEILSYRV